MKDAQRDQQSAPAPDLSAPDPAAGVLGGGPRGEVTGCPTGLSDHPEAAVTRQPGGAGEPATGTPATPPPSPGEGVTEEQAGRAGLGR